MRAAQRQRVLTQHWARANAFNSGAAEPDDWPSAANLDAHGLVPLSHGDHSTGQSAVYAAVNAVRLVTAAHHSWTDRDDHRLLASAWDWQIARGGTRPDRGTRVGHFCQLVDVLTFILWRQHGQLIELQRPWHRSKPTVPGYFATIERLIVSGHVVLGLFSGAHYSVMRGYTPSSLLLFDSGHRRWVSRRSTSLAAVNALARHQIVPTATLALSRRH